MRPVCVHGGEDAQLIMSVANGIPHPLRLLLRCQDMKKETCTDRNQLTAFNEEILCVWKISCWVVSFEFGLHEYVPRLCGLSVPGYEESCSAEHVELPSLS